MSRPSARHAGGVGAAGAGRGAGPRLRVVDGGRRRGGAPTLRMLRLVTDETELPDAAQADVVPLPRRWHGPDHDGLGAPAREPFGLAAFVARGLAILREDVRAVRADSPPPPPPPGEPRLRLVPGGATG